MLLAPILGLPALASESSSLASDSAAPGLATVATLDPQGALGFSTQLDQPLPAIHSTDLSDLSASIPLLATEAAFPPTDAEAQTEASPRVLSNSSLDPEAATAVPASAPSSTLPLETADLPIVRVSELSGDGTGSATDLAQITSVTSLTDVMPTDWAFQALQNLVEQYGCLQGYPDGTFRGNRSLTRYEFAAGLNACLDTLVTLIGSPDSSVDLATIQRLQEEFATELALVREQVDGLEARTAELEANQFATVTKLRANVFFHLGGGFANGDIKAEGSNRFVARRDPATGLPTIRTITEDPSVNYGYLAWINMDSSFTGDDQLTLQLAVGNGISASNLYVSAGLFNTYGTPFTFQTGGIVPNQPVVRELAYSFPIGNSFDLTIGPRINWYRFFDNNRYTFFLTGANSFNSSGGTQVNTVDRGAGAIAVWDIASWVDLRLGFLAESTEFLPGQRAASDPDRGLFGGTNTLTAQVGLRPLNNLNLRFLYTRSNLEANAAGQIGGTLSEPLYGFADDGFGGPLQNSTADTFLVNFDWTPLDWLGFFGRYSYGSTHIKPISAVVPRGSVDAQSLQLGVAFPDLFKEGALATISYLRPFALLGGREFLVSGNGNGGVQQEVEVSYRLPISQNIALMPSFYWIDNANNFSDNPDLFFFNFQTQFLF